MLEPGQGLTIWTSSIDPNTGYAEGEEVISFKVGGLEPTINPESGRIFSKLWEDGLPEHPQLVVSGLTHLLLRAGSTIKLEAEQGILTVDTHDIDVLTPLTHVYATRNSTLSIPHADAEPFIFDDVVRDPLGEYNATTGVFTAEHSGYYLVCVSTCSATGTAWAAGEYWLTQLYHSSGDVFNGNRGVVGADSSIVSSNLAVVVYLYNNDTLQPAVYQTQGAAVNCHTDPHDNFITIDRILG
jgi:hypothetical protein